MKRWRRRLAGAVTIASLLALTPASGITPVAVPSAGSTAGPTAKPIAGPEHVRGLEQTLLTYPEWFLVFSPHEYGEFIGRNAPSRFPFFGHIGQFWEGYKAVFDETQRRSLDLNPAYHLMIMVIGTSTTVEYAIKSAYETLIGRLTEAMASWPSAEDRYAAQIAQDYVRFIRVDPWYLYDFGKALSGLWRSVPATGSDMIRKWERRFALSTEYLVKMGYAKLIKMGTQSIYDAPLPVTALVAKPVPEPNAELLQLKVISPQRDGSALITVPRYEAFTAYAQAMSAQGVNFSEIAGNNAFILVSVLAPVNWKPANSATALLVQPILTQPGTQRVLVTVPVPQLAELLREWKAASLQVEHVFDY